MPAAWIAISALWVAWLYPFLFRAPHNQKRPSITLARPTRIGLLLEVAAIFVAILCRTPAGAPLPLWRIAGMLILALPAVAMAWSAVRHLGRQFRVNAGLYEDHQLVRTGAYAIVRHPIYASLFAMLGGTLCFVARWECALFSIALFVAGTEIRVRTEDRLLESRFGAQFHEYRARVAAYVPFVR
jgi:protein-S-isoprenylcysteine O-methyltransferase Ste14